MGDTRKKTTGGWTERILNKLKHIFDIGIDHREAPKTDTEKPSQSLTKTQKDRNRPEAAHNRRPKKKPLAPEKSTPEETWSVSRFTIPPLEGKTRFHDLDLPEEIMHAIYDLGFSYCTAIQAEILPHSLVGRDMAGRAQTGTGKTAAFLITILSRLHRNPLQKDRNSGIPRALILAPTRELVIQIAQDARSLAKYLDIAIVEVFGGMDYKKQKRGLTNQNTDIMIATPGRLIDFQNQGLIDLSEVEMFVIDEADRMLDMGFIPDVRRIIRMTPPKIHRQTLLFSATLTPEVMRLASNWTTQPVHVEIEPEQVAVDTVEQIIYIVTLEEKFALLYNIIQRQKLKRVLIFCNRRDETRITADKLRRYGIPCSIISGDVRQNKRIKTLDNFKLGKIRVMVATDVAGRGIHIEGISHVINYTLPENPENYVHRIGRTGRAGAEGTSVSFATEEDAFKIPDIEEYIGYELRCIHPDNEWLTLPPPKDKPKPKRRRSRSNRYPKKNKPNTFNTETMA